MGIWRKFIIFATVSPCREPCRFGIMARCRRRACNIINKNTHSMKQKRLLFLSLLTAATMATAQTGRPAAAPTWTEWHDLEINEVNRLPLHTEFFAFNGTEQNLSVDDKKQSKNFLSLDGGNSSGWSTPTSGPPTSICLRLMTLRGPRCLCRATGNSTAMATRSM